MPKFNGQKSPLIFFKVFYFRLVFDVTFTCTGFVVVWWPRYRMSENVSKVVDKTEFKCLIELAEEDTEYEIMVVPETTARIVLKIHEIRIFTWPQYNYSYTSK